MANPELSSEQLQALYREVSIEHEPIEQHVERRLAPVKAEIHRRTLDKRIADQIIQDHNFASHKLHDQSENLQFAALLSLLFIHADKSPVFCEAATELAMNSANPQLQSLAITSLGYACAGKSSKNVLEILRNLRDAGLSGEVTDAIELSIARIRGVPPEGEQYEGIRQLRQFVASSAAYRKAKLREFRAKFGDDFMKDYQLPPECDDSQQE